MKIAILGNEYTDRITRHTGVAVSRTEFLYGCVRVCLESADKDGKPQLEYFDEQRLEGVAFDEIAEPKLAVSGGPGDAPKQWSGEGG